MADSFASTPFDAHYNSFKGKRVVPKRSLPKPGVPRCQGRILTNGICETAVLAAETASANERRMQFDNMQQKQNLITELITRLRRWNEMQCSHCKMALKDQGPQVPFGRELAYIESPNLFNMRAAMGEELPDSTEALAHLERIGDDLARLKGDVETAAGSSTPFESNPPQESLGSNGA